MYNNISSTSNSYCTLHEALYRARFQHKAHAQGGSKRVDGLRAAGGSPDSDDKENLLVQAMPLLEYIASGGVNETGSPTERTR